MKYLRAPDGYLYVYSEAYAAQPGFREATEGEVREWFYKLNPPQDSHHGESTQETPDEAGPEAADPADSRRQQATPQPTRVLSKRR